ncbi:curli production assembly/transport component CsgG [Silanimonas algicola]
MLSLRTLAAALLVAAAGTLPAAAEPLAYSVAEGGEIALPQNLTPVNTLRLVQVRWSPYAGRKARVAVSKIDNTSSVSSYTANDQYGTSNIEWAFQTVPVNGIEAMITDALNQSGRFRLVERQAIGNVMQEQDFGASGRVASPSAAGMGQILGAEYLVEAVITSYDPGTNAKSTNVGGIANALGGSRLGGLGALAGGLSVNSSSSSLGMNIRLIDATTSEVVFTKQIEREIKESGIGFGGAAFGGSGAMGGFVGAYSRTPIGQAVIASINEAVFELAKQVGAQPATGSVIKVEGSQAYINLGAGSVTAGERLSVVRPGEALIDPETGISLGSTETPIGEVQVASVQERFSIATVQGGARLEARDRVKSLAPPQPIEFGPMVDELATKPRAARR